MKPFNAKRFTALTAALLATVIAGCANTRAGASLDLTPRLLVEVQRSQGGGGPRGNEAEGNIS